MAGSKPEIGAKIVLDGAEEYQRSLKEVANAQRTLNKEMKLAESEFKKTGDAQQLYNEKVRLLNAQMDNQKKKLETAQKALKELSDKGVDKNSDLWVKWNGILLDSQAKMNNLQVELNNTTAAMKDTADATEQATQATERATRETADYSETLKSIDKGVKFGNVLNGLRMVKDAVGGVISTAFRMGKALVMSQVSGGDWAREIMMGAAAADLSVEEYQARQYAQALSGIEYGPIDESIQELRKRLNSTGEDAVTLFKGMNELGIASRETELQALDAAKAFWDIVNALDEIENADTRNTLAERIFGDKYMSIRSLLNYGGEEYLKLVEEGRAAATVTEESVNALADMDEAVEGIKLNLSSLKHDVQAELAPGFTAMTDALSGVLTKFNEFIESEAGQAAFDKWNDSLTGIADSIENADLESVFNGMATALGKIVDAFEWMSENKEKIKQIWDLITPKSMLVEAGESAAEAIARHAGAKTTTPAEEPVIILQPEQTQQAKSAKEATEELMQMVKELKIAGAFKLRDALEESLANPAYAAAFESEGLTASWKSVIDRINSSEIRTAPESLAAVYELLEALKTAMDELTQTAESGGGGAMTAFNAAIDKGTLATKDTLKSGVAAAFAGLDSVFASMGTAHGAAYINALSAQMSRINSMLYASPSYAYGGSFGSAAQSAYASPTSGMYNVSIYIGKQRLGEVATPIVNAQMGAELQTLR